MGEDDSIKVSILQADREMHTGEFGEDDCMPSLLQRLMVSMKFCIAYLVHDTLVLTDVVGRLVVEVVVIYILGHFTLTSHV